METEVTIETGQRTDVLMTLPTGQRIAVEVQYSRLSGVDWLERHRLYRQAGVFDVWVQHARRYNELMEWTLWDAQYLPLRQLGGFRARVRINDLAATLVEHGQPLVYLTTETEDTAAGQVQWLVEPRSRSRTELDAIILQTVLTACEISDRGLVWPALVEAQRHYQGRVHRDTECAVRPPGAQSVERAPESHPMRRAAETELMRRLQAHQSQLAVWQAELRDHPVWYALVRRHELWPDPDLLPNVLGVNVPGTLAIAAAPKLWQAELFYAFVYQHTITSSTSDDWAEHLAGPFTITDAEGARRACAEFWQYLEYMGLLQMGGLVVFCRPIARDCPCPSRITSGIERWVDRVREAMAREVIAAYPMLTMAGLVKPIATRAYHCRPDCALR